MTYLYIMHDQKKLNKAIILEHVHHLKQLKKEERLVLSGPFTDHPGGMVVFNATSKNEALQIANQDPFIRDQYKSFDLYTLDVADERNDFGLQ
jgi:uncharacterized protein YciI